MIRIAIVEDSEEAYRSLEKMISDFSSETGETFAVDYYERPALFLAKKDRPQYDLLFLDIEMPGMDGMTFARNLRKAGDKALYIFVTNMAQYAIEGYDVDALDFMVKPVNYDQFKMRMYKAVRLAHENAQKDRPILLDGGKRVIHSPSILYLEVRNHDIYFHLENETVKTRGTMKQYEALLSGYSFARCSDAFIVNLEKVRYVDPPDIHLEKDATVPLSRTYKKQFMLALAEYAGRQI